MLSNQSEINKGGRSKSRVARSPIFVPDGINVVLESNILIAKKGKDELRQVIKAGIDIIFEDNKIYVSEKSVNDKKFAGTMAANIQNIMVGLSQGFEKKLYLKGVGYKVNLRGSDLVLNVGKSHECVYKIPENVKIQCPTQTDIVITGIDKAFVSSVASEIISFRKHEKYGGKGILDRDKIYYTKEVDKK